MSPSLGLLYTLKLVNVLLFGATGMVGQGVLRECLLDPDVRSVVTIGRTATGQRDSKLREIVHADLWNYAGIEDQLTGLDACFFCLGVASAGMKEAEYTHMTYDLTLAAAQTLVRLNPRAVFVYVSGEGTDSSEKGPMMWARVKGRTENALLRLPFRAVYLFRPGIIQPLHGIQSRTKLYRVAYAVMKPVLPLLRQMFPRRVLTTEVIGRAMLTVVRRGYYRPILTSPDINAVVGSG